MAAVQRKLVLKAPVEKVFKAIAESENIGEIWSNISNVRNIQPAPSGGERFEFTYLMAGIKFSGSYEEIEYHENEKIVGVSKVGIESTVTWEFKPEKGGGTHVRFHADYKIPIPLIGKVAENIVVSFNENDLDAMIGNLRGLVE